MSMLRDTVAMPPEHRRVVLASGLGAMFEWYDFYLYGVLAPVLAVQFFSGTGEGGALAATLLAFAAGFVVRPVGALIFGRLGDLIGRKYTFLVTLLLMGVATVAIGLLPGQQTIGVAAPALLVVLRLLQGLAIGGEYGGVATYVAEHAPVGRRGFYTGWIQTTASLGLLLALLVIVGLRSVLGEAAFGEWGWRLPFLLSIALVVIGIWVRLSLKETPLFWRLKQAGQSSRAPLAEAFGRWGNLRRGVIALLGLVAAQAVVWYTGQFEALYFLTFQLKVDSATASLLMSVALALTAPLFVVFGALSDRVGRKPIMLAGAGLAAVAYLPLFAALTEAANPVLARAQNAVRVTLTAPENECGVTFDLFATTQPPTGCALAKRWLADRAVRSTQVDGPGPAIVTVQGERIAIADDDTSRRELDAALDTAGYPRHADPQRVNGARVIAILALLMVFVTMVYGPIAAALIEMFPTRVRCSAVSLPYHVGNGWFGGLLPGAVLAVGAQAGNPAAGLWVPIVVAAVGAAIGLVFVRETKGVDLERID